MKTRILSALALLIIFIPLIIIGELPFAILILICGILGLRELIILKNAKKNIPLILEILAYLITTFLIMNNYGEKELFFLLDYRIVAFAVFFFISPIVFINDKERYNINDALYLIGSILFIGLSFNLIILIRNYSLLYIIYLFLITCLTDVFALLTGIYIGKHKLCEKISPKKTIEGLVGGVIMAVVIGSIFYHDAIDPNINIFVIMFISMVLSLIGQVGDLCFSAIKRYYNKKDFSNLIPGHGGILDRFDSIIFVVLAFTLLIVLL
ncbi:MAG: phosphatidate cytidylyltransferase [Bacilli bacterium]